MAVNVKEKLMAKNSPYTLPVNGNCSSWEMLQVPTSLLNTCLGAMIFPKVRSASGAEVELTSGASKKIGRTTFRGFQCQAAAIEFRWFHFQA